MTDKPAHFIPDPLSASYLPANKVATTLCAQMSKMRLDAKDLLAVKQRGVRVTLPNGEPIVSGVVA